MIEMKDGRQIEKADVVISLNGRDGGKRFLVIDMNDEYSLLADGKCRKVEKPKRKKNKHVKLESKATPEVAEKLTQKMTNSEIRRVLSASGDDGKGGM